MNIKKDVSIKEVYQHIRTRGIKVVAFDFDQCSYTKHTGGSLNFPPHELVNTVQQVTRDLSPDFVLTVRQLIQNEVDVAIVTFSDDIDNQVTELNVTIGGQALIRPVLNACFETDMAAKIPIYALNPQWRLMLEKRSYPPGKGWHLAQAQHHFGATKHQVLLVDDSQRNVQLARANGYPAVKVNPIDGFIRTDILKTFF